MDQINHIKKYADGDVLPKEKKVDKLGMMYTQGFNNQTYGEIIDALLFEDSKEKKKDRRTRKAIFELLGINGFNRWYAHIVVIGRPLYKCPFLPFRHTY